MRFWITLILLIAFGCNNQNIETLVKINKTKSSSLQKEIAKDLEDFTFMVNYYKDAPAYSKLSKELTAGLSYLDAASENPEIFRLDSLIKQTKWTSAYQEEQANIITSLINSGQGNLIVSSLEVEFKRLKQILIKEALLAFDAISFRLDEPIVLIETDQESYKRGDQIKGKIRLVMGSSNMKSTIESMQINRDSVLIDDTGKGIINIPADKSINELEAEIKVRNAINGRYIFNGVETLIIE